MREAVYEWGTIHSLSRQPALPFFGRLRVNEGLSIIAVMPIRRAG